jgi:AbrB family looped-hinge helix DNA binding protein
VSSLTVQVAKRGVVTIPKDVREKYGIKPGDVMTFVDLGGVFVMAPYRSQVDVIADRISSRWREEDVDVEEMLAALREERGKRASQG